MRHVAEKRNMDLESLYTLFGWPLYAKYSHAFEAFKLALNDESVFDDLDIDEATRRELIGNIKRRLTPQAIKVRSDVECACFGYEGIDAVKLALKAGEDCSTDDISIKINLIAPPLYVISTNTLDKTVGVSQMEMAVAAIEECITKLGGTLVVKMKPRAVSENDDLELAQLMAKAKRENAEISGDEDGEPGDDE